MVRRIASQVHHQVSRLLRANYIERPLWYQAVLNHPPLPLPPKASAPRTLFDLPLRTQTSKTKKRVQPIYYLEDHIRRHFFRDHPFEAFRPRTLVEGPRVEASHLVSGHSWTRLSQKGRNVSSEDAIQFALNLHEHHKLPLSIAYEAAVTQFRALRAEWIVASQVGILEAESMGAIFQDGEITHAFKKEKKNLSTFEKQAEIDQGALAARKRWKVIVERKSGLEQWSKGEEYVRLWKDGIRPSYAGEVTRSVEGTGTATRLEPN